MGNIFSRLTKIFQTTIPQDVIMIGLDAAGKTTILYQMKGNEYVATIPTIGFNVEKIKIGSVTIQVYDVGGQVKMRGLWQNYYDSATGMVFVIDFADTERWEEARDELWRMLEKRSVPLLILANKADDPNCAGFNEKLNALQKVLELDGYNAPCKIFHVSGIPTKACPHPMDRLEKAFRWFSMALTDHSSSKI